MSELGRKIAGKRKDLGMTQTDLADRLCVTRQTVSRWEAGTVMPDVDKIADIASVLDVTCDYLLKDEVTDGGTPAPKGVGRLLQNVVGKKVKLTFFEEEADIDLYNTECLVTGFEGSWMRVEADTKKGRIEKLIPMSSVLSVEITGGDS